MKEVKPNNRIKKWMIYLTKQKTQIDQLQNES